MGFIHASQRLVFEVEYSLNIFKISSIIFHNSNFLGCACVYSLRRSFLHMSLFSFDSQHSFDHPSVTQGYFGVVNKGIYKPKDISVAVKTCKETLTQKQTKTLLKEGRSLVDYDHPNIVKFIGIAAIRPPVMIVMEYVAGKGSCKLHVCK